MVLERSVNQSESRYHKISHDSAQIERLFVDLFQEAHAKPPKQITLELELRRCEARPRRPAPAPPGSDIL
jgi:hypothetical protein